jgi:cytochrome c556
MMNAVSSRRSWFWACGIAVCCVQIAAPQGAREQIIQDRIAKFRELGAAQKNITDELKAGQPDLAKIQQAAQLIKATGAYIPEWFPPGSEPLPQPSNSWLETIWGWFSSEAGGAVPDEVKTRAKPAIWMERAKFEQLHVRFVAEAQKMSQSAARGRVPEISVQLKKLGDTCQRCHDAYRERED